MVVIHHNPDCGTSRNVLQIIKAAGYNPIVIEYLKEGWTKSQLLALFAAANLTPKTALRVSKSPAKKLGLLNENITDEAILEAMLAHPVLVNRPIVCTEKGVKLCRPSEQVLTLLAQWPKGELYKEDGEMILNAQGEQPKN
ncbi:Arsenate reductase [Pseudoalteromonas sp. P1-13-1a]|uniref:Arsenate reductase (Glutaredoxin) n=1 Tax=Pseudoalteromonas undina TaxID=43660 RepID=A0ACC6R1U9_9GAMM|nr:arsenate reductase (glutaredoxin) [Pseudoalteromonas sp. P1-13-1a]KPZ59228.1 Arsenate reductase [Pseudoalteromonas sp. P1-13-1a]